MGGNVLGGKVHEQNKTDNTKKKNTNITQKKNARWGALGGWETRAPHKAPVVNVLAQLIARPLLAYKASLYKRFKICPLI